MKRFFAAIAAAAVFCGCVSAEDIVSSYTDSAFESGIITGNENGDFEPEKFALRAELAVMLKGFFGLDGGKSGFSDVNDGDWFSEAAAAVERRGLMLGDGEKMNPYSYVTVSDAVTAIGRYYGAESENMTGTEEAFEYAARYYSYALENGLLDFLDDKSPQTYMKKGDVLVLLYSYDMQSTARIRFMGGYPKISSELEFGKISLDIKTNKPCTVYYGLAAAGSYYYSADVKLCTVTEKNKVFSAKINANVNEKYDLYIKAVDSDGINGGISVIKNISPFSIASGNGTEKSPYIIYTGRQLEDISLNPSGHYRLEDNIELADKWRNIENFSGVLDGNGYKITGMTIDSGNENEGLFGKITGGTVKSLYVEGNVKGKESTGIIAGINEGEITECVTAGTVGARTNNAGGIAGINKGKIESCLSAVYSVTANSFAGGAAGKNYGIIGNCLSAAETVVSDMYAGGIAGTNENGEIASCVAACSVIYDTMTLNSGRLTTNKKNGVVERSYCYADTVSNAAFEEENKYSQNGYDANWEDIINPGFYEDIGWNLDKWEAAENGYRLIYPKKSAQPELEPGKTIYFPKRIFNEEDLRNIDKNEEGHYILANDITLKLPWKTICTKNGFSGTLDGNGYTVHNLNLKSETGMFSNITGGTVRNLTLNNSSATPGGNGGILTACNYGYIVNCAVNGKLSTKKAGLSGAVAGENYGEISACSVNADINNDAGNAVVGGICAENSGIVTGSFYGGKITADGKNAVVGGICGYNMEGYVFESFSDCDVKITSDSAYGGGICGISSGQIYKCASDGIIASNGKKGIYAGGICGLSEDGTVYNCYSFANVNISGKKGYAGGIAGYISNSNVQNTYSAGGVAAQADSYTGGICGYAENGFVMQNVSVNTSVNGGIAGAVIGVYENGGVGDNYSCEKTIINSAHIASSDINGTVKSFEELSAGEFYFKKLSDGGVLGWDAEVWTESEKYDFPVLTDVPGQN